jgi:hypothetical protein
MDQSDPDTWPNKIMTHGPIRSQHVDQRDPDTWLSVCMYPRQHPAWYQATSVASMATKHASGQRGSEPRQLPECTVPRGGHFHDEISDDVH